MAKAKKETAPTKASTPIQKPATATATATAIVAPSASKPVTPSSSAAASAKPKSNGSSTATDSSKPAVHVAPVNPKPKQATATTTAAATTTKPVTAKPDAAQPTTAKAAGPTDALAKMFKVTSVAVPIVPMGMPVPTPKQPAKAAANASAATTTVAAAAATANGAAPAQTETSALSKKQAKKAAAAAKAIQSAGANAVQPAPQLMASVAAAFKKVTQKAIAQKKKETQSAGNKFRARKPNQAAIAREEGKTGLAAAVVRSKRSASEADEGQSGSGKATKKARRADGDEDSEVDGGSEAEEDGDDQDDDDEAERNDPQRAERTLFFGNVDVNVTDKVLRRLCAPFGVVVSVRFRSVAFISPKLDRKVAFARGKLHPERHVMNAYVVMREAAVARRAALALNGTVLEGKHLRVDIASNSNKPHDHRKSVFVGNLPMNAEEEALWEAFGKCGDIATVRLVRDAETNVGKGFGFVSFKDAASIDLAVRLHEIAEIGGRKLRVTRAGSEAVMKKKKEENVARQAEDARRKQIAIARKAAAKGSKSAKLRLSKVLETQGTLRSRSNGAPGAASAGQSGGARAGGERYFQGAVAVPGSVPKTLLSKAQQQQRRLKKVRTKTLTKK
ncbi:hypothetical protein CAOG_03829 [Capsaspora owczarzaki ATCC 30864]|uniref:RRM domain-containing protein n=1 Tax=Capsaspora owczarzaki (strain ATCC 30864) TaxID=595528 RepID=A0A0D2VQK2_CAPO3|nr:hypothetical protein CAOG_03829 [Capsaspora owczarzaki ATCC 30864]KJE92957.1 hypothetical protein CAOG_003829 [Capsaspora owczarzaki ATCC 30864]|eukprot:XP_004363557.1 hypothetical protein CAOG_03829 [Capsaspora owczarzaki ATCC 30864]